MRHRAVQIMLVLAIGVGLVLTGLTGQARHLPDLDRAIALNDHGHSHDVDDDLAWAGHGHGHSHDGIDHDHQTALTIAPSDAPDSLHRDTHDPTPLQRHVWVHLSRIDRPPIA